MSVNSVSKRYVKLGCAEEKVCLCKKCGSGSCTQSVVCATHVTVQATMNNSKAKHSCNSTGVIQRNVSCNSNVHKQASHSCFWTLLLTCACFRPVNCLPMSNRCCRHNTTCIGWRQRQRYCTTAICSMRVRGVVGEYMLCIPISTLHIRAKLTILSYKCIHLFAHTMQYCSNMLDKSR